MRNPPQSPPVLTDQQQRQKQRQGGGSWSSSSPTPTPTPCCSKVGIKRGPWTAEEDEVLASFVRREGQGRWRTLPKRAGLLRCGKSCRLRWMNYLRPSIKRGPITDDEEDLILRLHSLLGNRWSLIAGRIPGRTDNEIKNYWNTHLSKKLVKQGIDPRTHKHFTSSSSAPPPPPPRPPPPPPPPSILQDRPDVGGRVFADDLGYKTVGCGADDVFSDLLMDSFISEDINFMPQQDHFITNNNPDGDANVPVNVVDSQNKDAEVKHHLDQLVGVSSIPGFALQGIWGDAFHYFS